MLAVNLITVFVATVAVFVLGWLWYSPVLFFNPWMRARGKDPAAARAAAQMPGGRLVVEFVRCLILVYVLAHFVVALEITTALGAAHFGAFLWLGVPAMMLIGSVLWDNTPRTVALIHAGDWLIKMLVAPIILAIWR